MAEVLVGSSLLSLELKRIRLFHNYANPIYSENGSRYINVYWLWNLYALMYSLLADVSDMERIKFILTYQSRACLSRDVCRLQAD